MNQKVDGQQELREWVKKTLNRGVHDMIDQNVFKDAFVEAQPAWVLPFTLLIGRIRSRGSQSFKWLIAGDCPSSHIEGTVASTPRDAARHFALNWQLSQAQKGQPNSQLIQQAEALYEIVELEDFWLEKPEAQT